MATDPWAEPAIPADPATEAAVRRWLEHGDLTALVPGGTSVVDDSWFRGPWRCPLAVGHVEVDDFFTAGARAAAAVRLIGTDPSGLPGELHATLIAEVAGGEVVRVRAVTDRLALAGRLADAEAR